MISWCVFFQQYSMLFGDKGLKSCPLLINYTVSGCELISFTVLAMSFCRDSSCKLWPCVCNNDASIPLAKQIWHTHIPFRRLAGGGFLFHLIQSAWMFWRNAQIFVLSISLNPVISSCSAPRKFDPLSEYICLVFPLLVINLLRAWMKES